MNRSERSLAVLKKARELMRDSLYLKYGEAWAAHDRSKGMFFAEPSEEDKQFMAFLLAYADGDAEALAAVRTFSG